MTTPNTSNIIPYSIKIYHIAHLDKLPSILNAGGLFCDAEIHRRSSSGTTIGMGKIKQRRLFELRLSSYNDLHIGDCVPFYFCPRSVMLYMISRGNHPELDYHGGQEPIIHLMGDWHSVTEWARRQNLRYAFTTSNAGSYYFEDYVQESDLAKINWEAVNALQWQGKQEEKQAEFLMERFFPLTLIEKIGVYSPRQYQEVYELFSSYHIQIPIEIRRDWYY